MAHNPMIVPLLFHYLPRFSNLEAHPKRKSPIGKLQMVVSSQSFQPAEAIVYPLVMTNIAMENGHF